MSSFLIQNRFAGMIMFLICIGKILAVAINKKKRCFKNYWMVNRVILNIAGLVCDFVFILNICYERVVYHKILRTNQMLFCLIFVKFVKTLLSWKKNVFVINVTPVKVSCTANKNALQLYVIVIRTNYIHSRLSVKVTQKKKENT